MHQRLIGIEPLQVLVSFKQSEVFFCQHHQLVLLVLTDLRFRDNFRNRLNSGRILKIVEWQIVYYLNVRRQVRRKYL